MTLHPKGLAVHDADVNWKRMAQNQYGWRLSADLLGGTDAMQEAGEAWLPRFPREDIELYRHRLAHTVLYPGFERAIEITAARPFSRPIIFENGDLPDGLRYLQGNFDGEGSSITAYHKTLMTRALQHGMAHSFMFMPKNDAKTLAEEKIKNPRPYFRIIAAPNLLAAIPHFSEDGTYSVSYVKFLTWEDGDDGLRVQVIYEFEAKSGRWAKYKEEYSRALKDNADDHTGKGDDPSNVYVTGIDDQRFHGPSFVEVDSGTHSFTQGLPLRTFYTNRYGRFLAKSPFQSVAEMNLTHWRSSSDQRNILHYARAGILHAAGFSSEDKKSRTSYGPSRIVWGPKESTMRWVEVEGKGAEIGRQDLKDLEREMDALGARIQLNATGTVTATEAAIDEAKAQSNGAAWSVGIEMLVKQQLELAAEALSIDFPDGINVRTNSDNTLLRLGAEGDMTVLLQMNANHSLDTETLLREAQRRGMLSPELEVKDVLTRTLKERDEMSRMNDLEDEEPSKEDGDITEDEPSTPEDTKKQLNTGKGGQAS